MEFESIFEFKFFYLLEFDFVKILRSEILKFCKKKSTLAKELVFSWGIHFVGIAR